MVKFVLLISEASVTAGLAALAVMLIRLAMKKAPKRWAYALWAVVFFRCLCPFSAESALSLFNVIPDHAVETVETTDSSGTVSEEEVYVPAIVQVERTLESYGFTTPPPAAAPKKPVPKKSPFHMYYVIFAVWAAGALAMALYGVISYIILMRKLRTAVKTEEGVYESDIISTAFSAGFFPPKIYVPCGLFEEERKLIIAHERVHIRRLDYIVKPVAFLALTVHWFNPLIWLSFALMTKDMELSCDEAVLKIFGAEEKRAYSEALLHVSMKRSGLIDNYKFMPLAFAETGIKGRVKNVLKYKKPTLIVTVLAAAVVIAACAALGTDAKSKARDTEEEINYELLQNFVNNCLLDADGEEILLLKEADPSAEKGIAEGEMSLDSVTFTIDKELKNTLIVEADITELKIRSMDVVREDGKNILKLQLEFKAADGFVNNGKTVNGDSFGEKLRLLMTEGGGNEGVYTVSAEYELEEDGSSGYSFRLYGFWDIPVYVNSDLVKTEEKAYVPISEGETVYSFGSGENIRIANYPHRDAEIADSVKKFVFNANPNENSKRRSILIGMRAKNNELNRQYGAEFTDEEIKGLAIDGISVSQDKFTVRFKITYPEGGGGFFVNENEPNAPIRLVSGKLARGEDKNASYLYLTADYDKENVDEYAVDIFGFDDIPVQIDSRFNAAKEKAAEYTAVSAGWTEFILETGEKGYAAYDVNDIPVNADDWSFDTKGTEGKGVSIGCITESDGGQGSADFRSVLEFGDHPITSVALENMYTERIGSKVKLYAKIRVASPEGDGLMNSMSVNGGEFEMGVSKLINGEYLFTVIKEYNIHEDVTASFAVVVSGFEAPAGINSGYDVFVYVNSELSPVQMPELVVYNSYKQIYGGEDMPTANVSINYIDDNITEEEKARIEEELRRGWYEGWKKQRQEEEQRKIAEENEKLLRSVKPLQYPVDGVITSGYGDGRGHKGIDFAAEKGTEVYAAADGIVSGTGSGWNGGYGTSVTIEHSIGMETVYAHLKDTTVKEGDKVAKGELIGHAGSTGDTTQNGIHFEVKIDGAWKDPAYYLAQPESSTENAFLARYFNNDTFTGITLKRDGAFVVENFTSSLWLPERPEKSYKFENGILSLEFTDGTVKCFEAVGNDLVYRKDLSDESSAAGVPSVNGTFELREGASLNGGSIEMETAELNGKTYYLVSNETQLRAVGKSVYGLDKNYIQQCDIELSSQEWKPIGTRAHPFTGSYNGNGFEIKGLTKTDPKANLIGMFGCAENANIYNITLRSYDIEKAGSEAKTKSAAPIVALNFGSRVYDNNVYPKGE